MSLAIKGHAPKNPRERGTPGTNGATAETTYWLQDGKMFPAGGGILPKISLDQALAQPTGYV